MTASRKRNARYCLLTVLLCMVAASASARDVRMQGPNGDGGTCPDAIAESDAPAPAQQKRAQAGTRDKAKAAPMVRSGGDNAARPRWHSFLPGMFR